MAQGMIWARVSFGIASVPICVSRVATRVVMGMVGYRRSVSLQTAFRMGRLSISVTLSCSLDEGEGRAARTSSPSCLCQLGCVARSQTAHVMAEEVVSCLELLAEVGFKVFEDETYPAAKKVSIWSTSSSSLKLLDWMRRANISSPALPFNLNSSRLFRTSSKQKLLRLPVISASNLF